MNRTQRDLLASCWNRRMKADYGTVQGYATRYRKYDAMTMRQIDEVVAELERLYKQ